jgi:uncharacterized membrane protein YeaQ/YmgE (transglycosylase-associated protein family)
MLHSLGLLHTVAFIVIGVVIGAALVWGRSAGTVILGVVLGLVGSFVAGDLMLRTAGKYGSLVAAVVGALILGFVARYVAASMSGSRGKA